MEKQMKLTLELEDSVLEFFKRKAKEQRISYKKAISNFLEEYAQREGK